jgi:hypothetical protein
MANGHGGKRKNQTGRPSKANELKEIEAIDTAASLFAEDNLEGRDAYVEVFRECFTLAIAGDVSAMKLLLDRRFGKSKETIKLDAMISKLKIGLPEPKND